MRELLERMELTEGLIGYPPKLYAEIMAWIVSATATLEVDRSKSRMRDVDDVQRLKKHIAEWKHLIKHKVSVSDRASIKASKDFKFSLNDWPQLTKRIRVNARAKVKKQMAKMRAHYPGVDLGDIEKVLLKLLFKKYDKLTVNLLERMPGSASGAWNDKTGTIMLLMPGGWSDAAESAEKVEASVGRTLRHELIHVAQSIMSDAFGMDDDVSGPLLKRSARPGMPSKSIMTPDVHQGLRDPYEPKATTMRMKLSSQGIKAPDLHGLDDIEFYTRLSDAIDDLKKVSMTGLSAAERNKAIGIFTGSISPPPVTPNMAEWRKFDPKKKIYPLMFPGHMGVPRGNPSILVPNETFMIWKRNARGKWKKAVKELTKAVG